MGERRLPRPSNLPASLCIQDIPNYNACSEQSCTSTNTYGENHNAAGTACILIIVVVVRVVVDNGSYGGRVLVDFSYLVGGDRWF